MQPSTKRNPDPRLRREVTQYFSHVNSVPAIAPICMFHNQSIFLLANWNTFASENEKQEKKQNIMKLIVFFVMVALCVAGSIFTAFDKMRKLNGIEKKSRRATIKEIRDIVTE